MGRFLSRGDFRRTSISDQIIAHALLVNAFAESNVILRVQMNVIYLN